MTEIMIQKAIKPPNYYQRNFMENLKRWGGVAMSGELGPQVSQQDNSARQTCKRRGWVTFDKYYWRLTDAGRDALKVPNGDRGSAA